MGVGGLRALALPLEAWRRPGRLDWTSRALPACLHWSFVRGSLLVIMLGLGMEMKLLAKFLYVFVLPDLWKAPYYLMV